MRIEDRESRIEDRESNMVAIVAVVCSVWSVIPAEFSPSALMPGDYNNDWRVDFEDFALLGGAWPQMFTWIDLSLLAANWLADATAGHEEIGRAHV
jgi:hypothetical protein